MPFAGRSGDGLADPVGCSIEGIRQMIYGIIMGFFLGLTVAILCGNIVHRKQLNDRAREKGIRFVDSNGVELTPNQFLKSVFDKDEVYE